MYGPGFKKRTRRPYKSRNARPSKYAKWDTYILTNYKTLGPSQIARLIGCNKLSIIGRYHSLQEQAEKREKTR